MNRIRNLALMTACAWLVATTAWADEPGAPPRQARELECLIGTWAGDGTVEMGGQEHAVQINYSCRRAAGGFGIACHLTMTGIPGFTYELDDLWGYDPGSGRIHWYTVTNAGETHDHQGHADRTSFRGSYVGRREGRPMRENVSFVFDGNDRFTVRSTVYVARQRVESVVATIAREPSGRAELSSR